MFSSNTRRASTVSDVLDNDGDGSLLAGVGAHPSATSKATSRPDENLVDAMHLSAENVPAILTGDAAIGDSGFRY